uniref:RNA-directed RNA polymerase n=1 Tax=Rhizoctonia solani negative-stranded virus 2 TaxID=1708394 RepID=A0A0M3SUQ0_9VIRU|nr:RNA-dependent RNA polymerase [Rhizoctonia solani negative-stranded virus 2]
MQSILTPRAFSAAISAMNTPNDGSLDREYITPILKEDFDGPFYDYRNDKIEPKTEIPSRLDTPLIPYPPSIMEYLSTRDKELLNDWQTVHRVAITTLIEEYDITTKSHKIGVKPITTSIDDLKSFQRQVYTARGEATHKAAYSVAADMAFYDLSLMIDRPVPGYTSNAPKCQSIDLLLIIQRLRGLMMKGKETIASSEFEPSLVKKENGVWNFYCYNEYYNYDIFLYGEHFIINHSDVEYTFLGPKSYLDYLYTLADVENNITIVSAMKEYSDFEELIQLLISSVIEYKPHNNLVTFYKNYEALCLYIADVKSGEVANWDPILDTINNMIEASNPFTDDKLDLEWALEEINVPTENYKGTNLFKRMMSAIFKLTPLQLLEASSLHKFVFFAEVDVRKGLNKFVMRTHTKVDVERDNLIELISLTKREFILNYYKRHEAMPNLCYPEDKINIIANYLKSKKRSQLEEYPLTWWYELKFGKTLDYIDGGHPVEFAKDKGAIIQDIKYGPMDNKRELLQVMSDPDYKTRGFLNKISTVPRTQEFIKTKIKNEARHFEFPVRLCEKEKEQKVEARLFGVADAKFKHEMSSYMAKSKEVLSYFDENYMTMSDSMRKEDLHNMAQLLERDDTLAIMIDITGHNQSMQPNNTEELLEFIGNIYGEDGWGKLSHLFNNLEIYHYNHYTNEVHISRGQHGGIEGWMNPIWTLVTLQQVKLLRYTTPLIINKIAGYSDDVSFIITSLDQSDRFINNALKIVSRELGRLGFVVKPQQSAVSKRRVTMLRTHYVCGMRADSTLKRLLSLSTANSDKISCEEFEINAISSSTSSAMEGSYHVKTATMLKWYKSCLVSFRTFAMLFEERRVNSMLSPIKMPADIASILYNIDGTDINIFEGHRRDITKTLAIKVDRIKENSTMGSEEEYFKMWLENIKRSSIEQIKSISIPDALLFLSTYHEFIPKIWFYFLAMPQSLGGLGVELCINQCLSGHSDNLFRQLYYIHRIFNTVAGDSIYFNDCIKYALKHHNMTPKEEGEILDKFNEFDPDMEALFSNKVEGIDKIQEVRLLTNKWLVNSKIRSALSKVQSSLFGRMKMLLKNKKLLDMLKAYDNRNKLAVGLTNIFRKNYSHRVIQFYYENSYLSMAQYLLKKLETSSSLLNGVKNLEGLKTSVSIRARNNALEMFSCTGETFGNISDESDILTYLINRRRMITPNINFVDIEEPLYDHLLALSTIDNSIMTIYPTTPKEYRNGTYGYKLGLKSSETLYKGEISEEDTILSAREEMLVCKLVSVTKWAVLKNNKDYYKGPENLEFDYIIACNWALSTFISENYYDLELYVPLNIGGEILHRIPNQKFKTKVATRIMPNTIQNMKAMLDQKYIMDHKLQDSNINFEYLRYRTLLIYAMNYHYESTLPTVDSYSLASFANIYDVQDYQPLLIDKSGSSSIIYPLFNLRDRINLEKLSIGTLAYLYSDNIHDAIVHRYGDKDEGIMRKIRERNELVMIDYYNSLSKEMLIIDFGIDSILTWKPLMEKLRKMTTEYDNITDLEFYSIIIRVISTHLHEKSFSNYHHIHKSRYSGHIQNLRLSAGELSEEYKTLVGYIKLNRNKVSEDLARNTKSTVIESMAKHFALLSSDVFLDLALGYCLHLRKVGANVEIDCGATFSSVLEVCENAQMNLNLPESMRATIFYIGPSRLVDILNKKRGSFISILRRIEDNTEDISTYEEKINLKYPSINLNIGELKIPETVMEVVYRNFEGGVTILNDITILNKSLKAMKRISELYTNQAAFASPTGSDSLVGQYGYFKALLDYNIINPHTQIVNLAAGRGDGRIACIMNGLNSIDYSRPSLFSKIRLVEGVNDSIDFDLTEFNTLPHIEDNSLVHIDISHITGNLSGLEDTILNLISNNCSVSLRANSITNLSDHFIKSVSDLGLSVSLWHATSRKILPYQCYILFRKSTTKFTIESTKLDEISEYKMMMNLWLGTISLHNLYNYPTEDIMNSIVALLPETLNAEELIKSVEKSVSEDVISNSIKQLIRIGEIDDYCIIDDVTVSKIMAKSNLSILYLEETGRHENYSLSDTSEIGDERRKGFKYWKEAVDELISEKRKSMAFNISQQSFEIIKELSHYYPIAKYRSFFHNLIILYEKGFDMRKANYDEYVQILAEHSGNATSLRANDNNLIREVLSVTIVAAMKYNYGWGIESLMAIKNSSTKDKNMSNKKLSIYRKMGTLFLKLRTQRAIDENTYQSLNKIEDAMKKKGLIKLRKLQETSHVDGDEERYNEFRKLFAKTAESFLDKINDGSISLGPSLIMENETTLEHLMGGNDFKTVSGAVGIAGEINTSAIVEQNLASGIFGNLSGTGGFTDAMKALMDQYQDDNGGEDMNWDDGVEFEEEYY